MALSKASLASLEPSIEREFFIFMKHKITSLFLITLLYTQIKRMKREPKRMEIGIKAQKKTTHEEWPKVNNFI